MTGEILRFDDGVLICGDCRAGWVQKEVSAALAGSSLPLIIADPPYGNIVSEDWDKAPDFDEFVCWMLDWTREYRGFLAPRGAFYVWGGTGKVGFRPFLSYILQVEVPGKFELANWITWSKKRAYGVRTNYLYTREELAYFVKGDAKNPRTFHVPYLDQLRGYAGYDPKHPALDDRLRRTNVWMDITEIFRGKKHPTQKTQKLHEVLIGVHTDPGDWVLDPFCGCGTTALAARKMGRKFICIEANLEHFQTAAESLNQR